MARKTRPSAGKSKRERASKATSSGKPAVLDPAALSDDDLALLNSRIGLKHLLAHERVDVGRALAATRYELAMRDLQEQLVQLQRWVIDEGALVLVIVEGRDAAGKGGTIRRVTAHINPRHYRSVALPKPTADELGGWYFRRYVDQMPRQGEMVFFDRSWYNRAVVEPVNGFCTEADYQLFMEQVNPFESMLVESGIHLIKLYLSIDRDEQKRRFKAITSDPLKQWKMSPVDRKALKLWDAYTEYQDLMLAQTNSKHAPWTIIDANDSHAAHLASMRRILTAVPWPGAAGT